MARKRAEKTAAVVDRVSLYALSVVSLSVVASRWVRLACQRHLKDLEEGQKRGLWFDIAAANRAIDFIERFCRLAGGEHEGRQFKLEPWQVFIVGSLFGWKGVDGFRRFRTAYIEIAKGNGKSPLAAAIGLYMLIADDEPRAECYAAATKKDQAMILFRDAVSMVEQSPEIAARLTKSGAKGREWNLAHLSSGSFYRPIASDDGQSGPRVHFGALDELHEHKDPIVANMMRAGTKGRRQALILSITNSGADQVSLCWEHHANSIRILQELDENDSWFAFVCGLDACETCHAEGRLQPVDECEKCDDFRDEKVWAKANPNLGVSVTAKYLREQLKDAEGIPSKLSLVKRLNFCIWTEHTDPFFAMDLWDACAAEPIDVGALELASASCYGGLDLASKIDTAAFSLVFLPDVEDLVRVLTWYWVPKERIRGRTNKAQASYALWVEKGLMKATEGNSIDFDVIREDILDIGKRFRILEIGFDPWNATQLATQLSGHGCEMVEVPQTVRHLSEPTKELESRVVSNRLRTGGNPVLRWMASNCVGLRDSKDNVLLSKKKSAGKIDGIAATVTAMSRLICRPTDVGSVYESRGLVRL